MAHRATLFMASLPIRAVSTSIWQALRIRKCSDLTRLNLDLSSCVSGQSDLQIDRRDHRNTLGFALQSRAFERGKEELGASRGPCRAYFRLWMSFLKHLLRIELCLLVSPLLLPLADEASRSSKA